jgi:sarcosine oxidase subunit beta
MNFDVVIIGGGLMGFSSALHLAMLGKSCVVLERDSAGRHASGVNAGGLRRLNRHPAEIPLAVAAAEQWQNIEALVGSDCDARFPGQIRVAENDQDMAKLEQRCQLVRELGYHHEELIDPKTLYQMLPALKANCVGGLLCRKDGYARPFHALTAFKYKACSLGVEYFSSTQVTQVTQKNGSWQANTSKGVFTAPILINCAGAWANTIARSVGEDVPLTPKAPMMMVTERLPHFIDPVVGSAGRKLSFKQMQNGTLLIGGAHLAELDLETQQTQINWRKLAVSARSVLSLFPQLKNVRIVRTWAGIEGFTPDSLPIIGASTQADGLFHCFGFSAHGFQLSPIVGRIMSELVVDGHTEMPIEPFTISRFL